MVAATSESIRGVRSFILNSNGASVASEKDGMAADLQTVCRETKCRRDRPAESVLLVGRCCYKWESGW